MNGFPRAARLATRWPDRLGGKPFFELLRNPFSQAVTAFLWLARPGVGS